MNANPEVTLEAIVASLGLRQPTPEQAAVATFPPRSPQTGKAQPLLVVAGAGSGKTETLALRATYLAARYGISGSNILGLTFTRKAAAELSERLQLRLQMLAASTSGDAVSGAARTPLLAALHVPEATTYNAFALGVVQEYGAQAGLNPRLAHMGPAAAWQLMSEVVASWTGELVTDHAESTVVGDAVALRDSIVNQALTPSDARPLLEGLLRRFEDARAEGKRSYTKNFHKRAEDVLRQRLALLDIIEEFDSRKAAAGMMDYADQVIAALKIVQESPTVRDELRSRFQVVFLDEFQDTSVAQMRFLSALFGDHPVTAVGDPNQAIYGWRGASAASLQDFHPLFNAPGVPYSTLTLSTAWRNDLSILRAANVLATPLAMTPYYARPTVDDSSAEVALPELEARDGAGLGISEALFVASTPDALEATVDFVGRMRRELSPDSGQTPASVAVLARRRRELQPTVAALRNAGIPAQIVGGDSLLLHPVIRDLRATLAVMNDIGKSTALLRLLTHLDLGAADLRSLGNYARRQSYKTQPAARESGSRGPTILLEAVEAVFRGGHVDGLSNIGRQRVARLGERLDLLRGWSGASLTDQVQQARAVMGYDVEALADPTSEDVTAVLDLFADTASDYETAAQRPTVAAFLSWLDASEERERDLVVPTVDIDPHAVQVMTIHASKGLEWDAVALVDMRTGAFPSANGQRALKSQEDGKLQPPPLPAPSSGWLHAVGEFPYPLRADHSHLPDPDIFDMSRSGKSMEEQFKEEVGQYREDEERRLAYVAVTRARRALLLVGSWMASGVTPRQPSVFLTELFADAAGHGTPADFMDGQNHEVVWVDRDNPRALTSGSLLDVPPEEDRGSLVDSGTVAAFPRDPGPARQRGEQSAARVREEFENLSGSTATREAALAGLADPLLGADVSALLAERDHEREVASETPTPDELLDRMARTRPMSVTELSAFAQDPEQGALDLVRPIPMKPARGSLVGTALHAWMESRLRTLSVEGADKDLEPTDLEVGPLDAEGQRLLKLLTQSASAVDLSGYSVVGVEVPFSVADEGRIVRGRIDAVLKDHQGNYLLVDWKTAQSKRQSLSERERIRYRTQLAYYEDAWRSVADSEGVQVSSALVFIFPGGHRMISAAELGQRPRSKR